MHLLIVGLVVVGGLWLFRRAAVGPQVGEMQGLPAPDPIPSGPGQALLSPAMGSGSPLYQSTNTLRLNQNAPTVQGAAQLLTVPGRVNAPLPAAPFSGWLKPSTLPSSNTGGGLRATPPPGATPWVKI